MTLLARLRTIRTRWINHRWLTAEAKRNGSAPPQWTCCVTLSGPERWRDPVMCDRPISVLRRVLVGHCGQHRGRP